MRKFCRNAGVLGAVNFMLAACGSSSVAPTTDQADALAQVAALEAFACDDAKLMIDVAARDAYLRSVDITPEDVAVGGRLRSTYDDRLAEARRTVKEGGSTPLFRDEALGDQAGMLIAGDPTISEPCD